MKQHAYKKCMSKINSKTSAREQAYEEEWSSLPSTKRVIVWNVTGMEPM